MRAWDSPLSIHTKTVRIDRASVVARGGRASCAVRIESGAAGALRAYAGDWIDDRTGIAVVPRAHADETVPRLSAVRIEHAAVEEYEQKKNGVHGVLRLAVVVHARADIGVNAVGVHRAAAVFERADAWAAVRIDGAAAVGPYCRAAVRVEIAAVVGVDGDVPHRTESRTFVVHRERQ